MMLRPATRTDRIYNLQSQFCGKCMSRDSRETCPYCVVEWTVQKIVVEDMRVEMREAGDDGSGSDFLLKVR